MVGFFFIEEIFIIEYLLCAVLCALVIKKIHSLPEEIFLAIVWTFVSPAPCQPNSYVRILTS